MSRDGFLNVWSAPAMKAIENAERGEPVFNKLNPSIVWPVSPEGEQPPSTT